MCVCVCVCVCARACLLSGRADTWRRALSQKQSVVVLSVTLLLGVLIPPDRGSEDPVWSAQAAVSMNWWVQTLQLTSITLESSLRCSHAATTESLVTLLCLWYLPGRHNSTVMGFYSSNIPIWDTYSCCEGLSNSILSMTFVYKSVVGLLSSIILKWQYFLTWLLITFIRCSNELH